MSPIEHHSSALQPIGNPTYTVDMVRLLDCLEMVENGNPKSLGGKLCWTWSAWDEDAGGLPFHHSYDSSMSRAIAMKRLVRLSVILQKNNIIPNAYGLACVWNLGLRGTIKLAKSGAILNYAERVSNLYHDRQT